ncbi:GA module-containing protein, partial [Corynebacterium propinquum]|uniref:GA module-containing protein n=2 Tax=Corynebacterium propinquum TaxID=43769 RepID=UPI002542F4CE
GNESAFGKFEYDLEREVKKYFQSLVDSGEIKLGEEFTVPTPQKAFEDNKDAIRAQLIETQNPGAVAEGIARIYRPGIADESAFGKFEYDLEREVKKYFQSLVDSGEIKFAPGYSPQQPENSGNELEEAQQTAAAQIDAIRALTENEKTAFKEKIKAADSSSAISEILTAAKQMADEHVAEEAGKGTLEAEKDHAQKTIEGFTNLTAEQKSELKSQIAAAKTGAIVQNLIERAEQLNSKLSGRPGSPEQKPSGEGATDDSQVLEKPSSKFGFSNIAKGLFGVTAILGVIGIVFGGVAHAIKHFPGFEHVHNQVRETLTKFGIRF